MESALLQHRIIFLSDEINPTVANRVIAQLLLLDADNPEEGIELYVNSPGGSVCDGLAIIDAMRCVRAPVSTVCIGKAYSMAAWILAAGHRGHRFATPSAHLMIHQIAGGVAGPTADIQVFATHVAGLQDRLHRMLADWTGQPSDRIHRDVQRDFYMTAEAALSYGIIDSILEASQ